MEKSLKESIKNRQLFSSYLIQFIQDSSENDADAEYDLYHAVKLLHRISQNEKKLPKFYKAIDKEDFLSLTMFLTERLYELSKCEK
jgi:hypothetical protein